MKSKFNAVVVENGVPTMVTVSEEDKRNCDFFTGMPVLIENNKVLSNRTVGCISGFHRNTAGTVLCKVQWLEGAPPLMIKCEYVKSRLPRKMWILIQNPDKSVVADTIGFSTGSGYWGAQRGIYERRFFDKALAHAKATELQRHYGVDILVMSVESVRNATGIVAL